MFTAIIHNTDHTERFQRLRAELETQRIGLYTIFPSVYHYLSAKHGINLAHKQCVEYARVAGFNEICIMEDDVKFVHPNAFTYFLENKPKEYDIYLSGIYSGEILPDNTVKSFCGLHCYVVHSDFYQTFLSLPPDEHIDQAMSGKGRFVVCNPFAAIQYNGHSYNTGKVENYDSLLAGRELYKG
jgi:hypothetical protein